MKKLYFVTLSRSFHAKVQVRGSHGLSVMTDMAVLSGPIVSCLTRSKRVNEDKLYAYALARKKTGLHAQFQVHRCYG